jgi:hypothetical protein
MGAGGRHWLAEAPSSRIRPSTRSTSRPSRGHRPLLPDDDHCVRRDVVGDALGAAEVPRSWSSPVGVQRTASWSSDDQPAVRGHAARGALTQILRPGVTVPRSANRTADDSPPRWTPPARGDSERRRRAPGPACRRPPPAQHRRCSGSDERSIGDDRRGSGLRNCKAREVSRAGLPRAQDRPTRTTFVLRQLSSSAISPSAPPARTA